MTKVQQLYEQLNQELFEGNLPDIPCVENGRLKKTFGRCHMSFLRSQKKWEPKKIDIQKGLSSEQLRKTIVHEMCHAWASINYGETGHGKYFWHKMKECGYPDGHRLESGRDDAWVLAKEFGYQVGQPIRWNYRNKIRNGVVYAIRRRVIEAVDNENELHWRIPPCQIEVIAVQVDQPITIETQPSSEEI
jgi:hypothetical protein